jgi:hypothetical protein
VHVDSGVAARIVATALYLIAIASMGVKAWSSTRWLEIRTPGMRWTTPAGKRIYVLTKATPVVFGLCVVAASALLNAPVWLLSLLLVLLALITGVVVAAVLRDQRLRRDEGSR